jgi:hypothetical protein
MSALIRSMLSRANPARVVLARGVWLLTAALVVAFSASACDLVGGDDADDTQEQTQAQAEPAAAATAPPAAAAQPETEEPSGPTPPPESSATSGAGASAYGIIFPSIAMVSTDQGPVTGLVSSSGHVLVSLSALGGATSADVILSNGETLSDVPLAGADRLTDIAYLGPLEIGVVSRLPGAVLGDGERLPPGAPVFVIGFTTRSMPGDVPSISSGVFSGIQQWIPGDRTYLITDALSQDPMVGSVLVDGNGVAIGFGTEATVWRGRYVSTGDLARSLAMDMPMPAPMATWLPDPSSASTEHLVVVSAPLMMGELAVGDEATGETLVLSVGADVPGVLSLIDAEGKILQESNLAVGATIVTLRPNTIGPYRLILTPAPMDDAMEQEEPEAADAEAEAMAEAEAGEEADAEAMAEDSEQAAAESDMMSAPDMSMMTEDVSFSVSSNLPLMTLIDSDELQPLVVGEPLIAGVDAPGDLDHFQLPALAGEVYEVRAQSITLDMVLGAMGAGTEGGDDDSGGGFHNSDAMLTLAPSEDGTIHLVVGDFGGAAVGAYVLTVVRTVSVEGSDRAMAAEEGEAGEQSAMVMIEPASLPDPQGDLSLRGVITEDGLEPTLAGIGSSVGEDGSLIVPDEDGIFEVVASIIGPNNSTARLLVMDADGQIVVSGRVVANCETDEPCLSSAVYITPEDAPGPPGEWTVLLQPEGAGSGITEWQIEVHLYADMPQDEEEAMEAADDTAHDDEETHDDQETQEE